MQLKRKELFELFCSSLDNAHHLYKAAKETALSLSEEKYPSLGLAELALEELGKSYSCLAYYSKSETTRDWKIFWKEWRDHDLKAHRAFFYEFFCLLRIEIDGGDLEFPTNRKKFSKEKEAAFYVDIDKSNRKIHIPKNEITNVECLRRATSLIGLFSAAFYIKDWLSESNSEDFKNAISDYAYLTISTQMYQQDVFNVLEGMKKNNTDYDNGLEKIKELFNNEDNQPQ
jgi:AbiV family abortive infection protein